MGDIIPLFKSHYSINRSILTLKETEGPDSIFQIAKENELKEIYLVEDNMSSFAEAYKICKEENINLRYGVRFTICQNDQEKNAESLLTEHKVVVFLQTTEGYSSLSKMVSYAAKEGFYYIPRIDFENMKKFWHQGLAIAVPFYDSFLFNNNFTFNQCNAIDFPDVPVFFIEDNNVIYDKKQKEIVEKFCGDKYEKINTKSIYYKNKKDFIPYLTFRCISKRSKLNMPNFDAMSSDEFCWESFKEKSKND